jgi:hypothetical protein
MKRLKAGKKPYRATGKEFLTLLYDESKIDPNNIESGLLESPYLIKVPGLFVTCP